MPNPNERGKLSPEHEAMFKDLIADTPVYEPHPYIGQTTTTAELTELSAENARLREKLAIAKTPNSHLIAGTRVVSEPGAAVTVTDIILTEEAKDGLRINATLPPYEAEVPAPDEVWAIVDADGQILNFHDTEPEQHNLGRDEEAVRYVRGRR